MVDSIDMVDWLLSLCQIFSDTYSALSRVVAGVIDSVESVFYLRNLGCSLNKLLSKLLKYYYLGRLREGCQLLAPDVC
jgi:hypothetical protein